MKARLASGIVAVLAATGLVVGVVTLVGDDAPERSTPRLRSPSPSAPPSPSPSPTASPSPSEAPPHPVSLQALMGKSFDGRDFRVGAILRRTPGYTRYAVSYRGGPGVISGVMNVPVGKGPFPVVIANHGYRDPATYVRGEGLEREHDFLPRRGYIVLHPDYRNHAASTDDPNAELHLRLGYTEDVINAILAIQRSGLPYVDGERVAMLGRSMGGGVTLNAAVVRPDLIDVVILYAPVSSDTVDNFEKWTRPQQVSREIVAAYGEPKVAPAFWRNVSPRTFFDRITAPVMVHHGTSDTSTPYRWTLETVAELRRHGVDVTLHTYRGEPHVFLASGWRLSIQRTADFLDARL